MNISITYGPKTYLADVVYTKVTDKYVAGKVTDSAGRKLFFVWGKDYKFPMLTTANGRRITMNHGIGLKDKDRIMIVQLMILKAKDYQEKLMEPERLTPIHTEPTETVDYKPVSVGKGKKPIMTPHWFMVHYKEWKYTKGNYWRRTRIDAEKKEVGILVAKKVIQPYCNYCSFSGSRCTMPCATVKELVGEMPEAQKSKKD